MSSRNPEWELNVWCFALFLCFNRSILWNSIYYTLVVFWAKGKILGRKPSDHWFYHLSFIPCVCNVFLYLLYLFGVCWCTHAVNYGKMHLKYFTIAHHSLISPTTVPSVITSYSFICGTYHQFFSFQCYQFTLTVHVADVGYTLDMFLTLFVLPNSMIFQTVFKCTTAVYAHCLVIAVCHTAETCETVN